MMSVSLWPSLPMAKYYARRGSDHKRVSRYHDGAPFRTKCGWRLPDRMNEKIPIKRLDHVCWAVRKLDDALPLLPELMGMRETGRWQNEETGFRGVSLEVPGGTAHFELLEPLGDDSSLHRFLAARGPGLHHVTFDIEDMASAAPAGAA